VQELVSQYGYSWSYTFLTGKQDALNGKQERKAGKARKESTTLNKEHDT